MKEFFNLKWFVIAAIGIIILFWITRLYHLDSLPIFTDEAIYVRWAQIAKDDAVWRFISLTDGKQPSFIWAAIISLSFFHDPLIAVRMVSVVSGFFTLIGMFLLGRELFKNTFIGFVSAFLYVIYPMAVVYDRMALYDSMVGLFMVWGFYLTVLLVRHLRLDNALLLGFVIGGAVLTKSSGFFSIYLLPFVTLLIDYQKKGLKKRLIKWILLASLASLIGFIMYNVLRLSPFFHIIEEKNTLFVHPFHEWIQHPFETFFGNLVGMFDWLVHYMTFPLFFAALFSTLISKTFIREKLVLLIYCFAPFFALALFGNALYPRFILFMSLYLLPLAAYTIVWVLTTIKNKTVLILLLSGIVFFPLYGIYGILTDFNNSTIPLSDRNQFYKDWPSGVGVKESIIFFEKEAGKGPIFIATQGTFGLMPYAYEIYFQNNPNITVKGYYPVGKTLPETFDEDSQGRRSFFVFYQPCPDCSAKGIAPRELPLKQVLQIKKDAYDGYFSIYKIITD